MYHPLDEVENKGQSSPRKIRFPLSFFPFILSHHVNEIFDNYLPPGKNKSLLGMDQNRKHE